MFSYDLKVGYSCNNKCKHCVIDDSKDKLIQQKKAIDLSTEECFSLINNAVKSGTKYIILTGGEVSIRKDFPDLLKKCAEEKLSITVQSNGRLLGNKKLLPIYEDISDIRFVIALHGTEKIHDLITQVHGSFQETCNSIRSLVKMNKLVILKVVISKLNMNSLPEIVSISRNLGVRYICFAFPHGQGAARKNFREVIPTYTELKPHLDRTIQTANLSDIQIEFEDIPFCIIPKAMHLVGELKYLNGVTAYCTQVKEQTFNWDQIRKDIKSKDEKCSQCDLTSICEGVWSEYVETFGFIDFKPIKFPDNKKHSVIALLKNLRKDQNTLSENFRC
ncbi:MAG: radical SAM protein [Treponema sp.]|uniref:radical SAM protein n=1 Tax=Treponema sp. TaxID=166 RepID=UPI003FA26556